MSLEQIKEYQKGSILYQVGRLKGLSTKVATRLLKQNDLNLSMEQAHILGYLYYTEGAYMNELSNELKVDNSAITRIIDILEKKNYVTRTASEIDRRQKLISLTEEGINEIKKTKEVTIKHKELLLKDIDKQDINLCLKLVKKMQTNMIDALEELDTSKI